MTYEELLQVLAPAGLPFAYHHWEAPPAPPYGVYFDDSTDNFGADNIAYHKITHYRVELYELQRDRAVEGRIEAALDAAELFWERESSYIESEELYQVVYEIEV